FTDRVELRIKTHDGAAGHGPQVVRPEHVQQGVSQLRELVFDFFPQFAGQKGEAFQQSLNVRVGALLRQKPGELRMCLGKFPALQPQKAQLIPVEPVQLHIYCTLTSSPVLAPSQDVGGLSKRRFDPIRGALGLRHPWLRTHLERPPTSRLSYLPAKNIQTAYTQVCRRGRGYFSAGKKDV